MTGEGWTMDMVAIHLPQGEWRWNPDHPLGRPGGFGAVFAGEGVDGSQVAIKRLKVEAESEIPGAAEREMKMSEFLSSREFQHVMPVLDAGRDEESGSYFVVMPRASHSLQDDLDARGRLPEPETIGILLEVALGLQEVPGITHRDLKPANVLRFDDSWRVADFGIARFVEERTSSKTLKGYLTHQYAAPEQWNLQRATSATDVYALGCMAHALVSGNPPFRGGEQELAQQHTTVAPPDLPADSPRLRSLVATMLRKSPDSRPTLGRVIGQLNAIGIDSPSGTGSLVDVGAHMAIDEGRSEALREERKSARAVREDLALQAFDLLSSRLEDLFSHVLNDAPTARVTSRHAVELGKARLRWHKTHGFIDADSFHHSGWNVVGGALIAVEQDSAEYQGRSAMLWYTDIGRPDEGLRWYEVPYMTSPLSNPRRDEPFALIDLEKADLAASTTLSAEQLASRPSPIDDEDFEQFSSRWLTYVALAARDQLRRPSQLPE